MLPCSPSSTLKQSLAFRQQFTTWAYLDKNSNFEHINLTMSSRHQEAQMRRRTSQRMRLKMLRNLDEFKMHNPYRTASHTLPHELTQQLKKLEYLSAASIAMLCLPFSASPTSKAQHNLFQMAQAQSQQDQRFNATFGPSMLDLTEVEHQHYSHSEAQPTHPSNGPDIQQHQEQLHLTIYEDRSHLHDNLFQSRGLAGEDLHIMESEQPADIYHEDNNMEGPAMPVEDFSQYFNS